MTLKYDELKGWLAPQLTQSPAPTFSPGPIVAQLDKISPDAIVYLVRNGRGGLDTDEALLERLIFNVYVISRQQDYNSGEDAITEIDDVLLGLADSGHGLNIGSTYVAGVSAAGRGPALIAWDAAYRYHFSSSYEFLAER